MAPWLTRIHSSVSVPCHCASFIMNRNRCRSGKFSSLCFILHIFTRVSITSLSVLWGNINGELVIFLIVFPPVPSIPSLDGTSSLFVVKKKHFRLLSCCREADSLPGAERALRLLTEMLRFLPCVSFSFCMSSFWKIAFNDTSKLWTTSMKHLR